MVFETGRKTPSNPYSPWKSPPGSLQRTLVGRDHTVKGILEKTRRFCDGAPPKHCLLVGRRGLGKTHLLSLIYHFYEKKCIQTGYETISNCVLPVLLLEEERYSLNSLVIFLVKIYQKFSEKFSGEERWGIPEHLEADDDVIEYCFENLKNISKTGNKKIIILCDNLEEVFKQWQEKEYKKLRAFLSDQQTVMIIGTAVKIFKEIIRPKEPFYEFFEIVPLFDLSDSQMLELLKKRFIDDNLEEEFNRKKKHLEGKVAAIAKLTGGNPRLVVFLYDIVTRKNVFELEEATNELMESLSEYFRNRFSDLAPQERTILDAFAEMDGPATPKQISKKTRIKEQSTYAHIKNLKDAGFIEVVEFGKHKISRYDVTERLFRLWRQNATISGQRRFKVLIKLLKLYFTPEELKEDFHRSIKQLDDAFLQNKSKIFEERLHYLSYLQHAADGSLKFEIFDKMTDFLLKKGDYEKAEEEIKAFQSEIEIDKKNPDLKPVYKKLLYTHLKQERYVEASKDIFQLVEFPISEEKEEYIKILNKIIEKCPDDDNAWISKGKILVNAGDFKEALKCFDSAIKLNPKEPKYYYAIGITLSNLNRVEEAIEAFQKPRELGLDIPYSYYFQAVFLQNLKRSEEALPLIEKAIELDGNNSSYWEEKGLIIANLGNYEKALKTFQKASELNPEVPEYYHLQSVAQHILKRFEQALPLIDKAIELDGEKLAYWEEKAKILAELGKHEEGLKCFQESLELNPEDINHKLKYLGFLIYTIKDLEGAGNYLKKIEKTLHDQIRDNPHYLHYKSEYLILTCQFNDAISLVEKRLKKEPDDWDARLTLLINKACQGEFGEHMEGLPGKMIKENLEKYQIIDVTQFIYRIIEACLSKGDPQRANGLFLTLLRLNEWHKINEVQEVIGLYLRQLVDIKNRELFVNAVNSAREHITDKDLLELLKAFLYAGRYLEEGNKVILEEVFPEIREIILDMIEKFEE
ncbi:MAG: tetratricopeptide repeat protein [Candidatus Aminicenantes bacterium]|jgi:tetratricopeptide (TPR) repeat protein